MIRHVIWDFDGTLFDSYPLMTGAFDAALRKNGVVEDMDAIMAKFMVFERVAIDYFTEKYGLGDRLERDYFDIKGKCDLSLIKPFPGAVEALQHVIDCGGHNYIYTHRNHTADDIVSMNGMSGFFADIVNSERRLKHKPDPEAVELLVREYDMNRDEVLIVGDRDIEVLLAQNSGTHSCFFENGVSHCGVTPEYVIRSLIELKGIVGIGY